MTLGQRIRELREMIGINQTELSRRAKVSQATVSDYEADEIKDHRAATIMKLAAALETTPEYLLRGTGPRTIEQAKTDRDTLLAAFDRLNDSSRAALIAAAEAMNSKN